MPVMEERLGVSVIHDREMPYVTFSRGEVEDVKRSKELGRVVRRDQDFATAWPSGGKSNTIFEIESFFEAQRDNLKAGRIKASWLDTWEKQYELFKQGKEIPLNGTPIRGWNMLSTAQQNNLIDMQVLTVEQLAEMNEEGIKNFGMGGQELKRRAKAWIEQNESHEAGAFKMTELTRKNETLEGQVANLTDKIAELEKALAKKK